QPDTHEIKGIVRFPDGSPAAGVQVIVSTRRNRANVSNGRLDPESKATIVTTDDHGRFALARPKDLDELLVLHDRGFAEVRADDIATAPEIQLASWGRIELTVLIGDQPAANRDVRMGREGPFERKFSTIGDSYHGKTDVQGRYIWDRALPGPMEVSYSLN